MANGFNPAQIDFSALANLPNTYAQGQQIGRDNAMRDAFKGGLPMANGAVDFNAMAQMIAPHDPVSAMNIVKSQQMTPYQRESLGIQRMNAAKRSVPSDIQMLEYWNKNYGGSAQPSYVAPPDSEGVNITDNGVEPYRLGPGEPGMRDPSTAPAFLAEKFMSIPDQEALKAGAKNKAEMANKEVLRSQVGQQAGSVLGDLWNQVSQFDDTTLENALGPMQGGGSTWYEKSAALVPQTIGAISNYVEGGKYQTDEVRGAIAGSAEALGAVIKPFVRQKGEGPWTDADQARLIAIAGDLQRAKDKPEFERRFRRAISRINSAWDLNIDPNEIISNNSGSSANVQVTPPAMDMATDPPPGYVPPNMTRTGVQWSIEQ